MRERSWIKGKRNVHASSTSSDIRCSEKTSRRLRKLSKLYKCTIVRTKAFFAILYFIVLQDASHLHHRFFPSFFRNFILLLFLLCVYILFYFLQSSRLPWSGCEKLYTGDDGHPVLQAQRARKEPNLANASFDTRLRSPILNDASSAEKRAAVDLSTPFPLSSLQLFCCLFCRLLIVLRHSTFLFLLL